LGTTNYGNQTVLYRFRTPLDSDELNRLNYNILSAGVYYGMNVLKDGTNNGRVIVYPGDMVVYNRALANDNMAVKINTLSTHARDGVSPATPVIVWRYTYEQDPLNPTYADLLALAWNDVEVNDVILAEAIYDDLGTMVSVDYSNKTIGLPRKMDQYLDNLKPVVADDQTVNLKIKVLAGKFEAGSEARFTAEQYVSINPCVADNKIVLVYAGIDGNLYAEDGDEAAVPVAPDHKNKIPIAHVYVMPGMAPGVEVIEQRHITDVRPWFGLPGQPEDFHGNPVEDLAELKNLPPGEYTDGHVRHVKSIDASFLFHVDSTDTQDEASDEVTRVEPIGGVGRWHKLGSSNIGDLDALTTSEKGTVVGSLNSLKSETNYIDAFLFGGATYVVAHSSLFTANGTQVFNTIQSCIDYIAGASQAECDLRKGKIFVMRKPDGSPWVESIKLTQRTTGGTSRIRDWSGLEIEVDARMKLQSADQGPAIQVIGCDVWAWLPNICYNKDFGSSIGNAFYNKVSREITVDAATVSWLTANATGANKLRVVGGSVLNVASWSGSVITLSVGETFYNGDMQLCSIFSGHYMRGIKIKANIDGDLDNHKGIEVVLAEVDFVGNIENCDNTSAAEDIHLISLTDIQTGTYSDGGGAFVLDGKLRMDGDFVNCETNYFGGGLFGLMADINLRGGIEKCYSNLSDGPGAAALYNSSLVVEQISNCGNAGGDVEGSGVVLEGSQLYVSRFHNCGWTHPIHVKGYVGGHPGVYDLRCFIKIDTSEFGDEWQQPMTRLIGDDSGKAVIVTPIGFKVDHGVDAGGGLIKVKIMTSPNAINDHEVFATGIAGNRIIAVFVSSKWISGYAPNGGYNYFMSHVWSGGGDSDYSQPEWNDAGEVNAQRTTMYWDVDGNNHSVIRTVIILYI